MNKIAEKLEKEFYQVANESSNLFEVVVVFCAEEVEVKGENKQRIDAALKIVNSQKVPLIFLGTIKHIDFLKQYMAKNKMKIDIFYPTKRWHESSWTQIKSLAQYLKKNPFKNLLFVTHAYHIPRIKRYCYKYLPNINYGFLPIGDIRKQGTQVKNEIDKIIKYPGKGDLPLFIREGTQ